MYRSATLVVLMVDHETTGDVADQELDHLGIVVDNRVHHWISASRVSFVESGAELQQFLEVRSEVAQSPA